jgi:hypothetical protein
MPLTMELPNTQRRQLLIQLPITHWIELEDYAQSNGFSLDQAASDALLFHIGEWLAEADFINYLESVHKLTNPDETKPT